ncbi:hypothetical protein KKA24_01740, partial [Patescibacteria group bacterium]|nr:hypothetical protein [Patescibacteria group bacterium]
MKKKINFNFKILKIIVLSVFLGIAPLIAFASTTDGTVDSSYKYAWGENIGWIDFGTTNGNVHITDSGLSGYALSETVGWIYLDDVTNDSEGNLSGYAWGENVGYINFNPTNGGVVINSSGEFTGSALSETVGWIIFEGDYSAKTDWRPESSRPSSGGGAPAASYSPPTPAPPSPESPEGGFKVLINDNEKYTNNRNVSLKLFAGANVKKMAISNNSDLSGSGTGQITFEDPYNWDLCYLAKKCPDGEYTVYAKFYTQYGQPSEIVSDKIILDATPPKIEEINLKEYYYSSQNIIISGKTEPKAEILFHWNEKYGSTIADDSGFWKVNLGKLSTGDYELEVSAKDLIGNKSDYSIYNLVIKELETPEIVPVLEPAEEPIEEEPEEVITVPEESPITLKAEWDLFPSKSIKGFVLAPLPNNIAEIVKKFPELKETFEQVGITKITDVDKLKTTELTLSGLSDLEKIPTGIVFAGTSDRLIDINIGLSITDKGKLKQTIKTISGKPLQLTVKPESPAESIKGYLVLNSIDKSLSENSKTEERGLFRSLFASVASVFSTSNEAKIPEIEERMLLLEFEYTDPDGDGIYTAEIQAPVIEGEYEIITVISFKDPELGRKELRLITVIDPEGYVYEKVGDKETRIPEAVISIFKLNSESKEYDLWSGEKYQQKNPQTTNATGKYSFLVPEGNYYLEVKAPGYLVYKGEPFEVKDGSGIHLNIEL